MRVFGGSYMDGLEIDMVRWAGLNLTDDEHDRLLDAGNPHDVLAECPSAEVVIDEAIDDLGPGQNDTFYSVHSNDVEAFRAELRELIVSIVRGTDTGQR